MPRASPSSAAADRRAIPIPSPRPLSSRFDELDGQMWLDDVLIPWDRVFLTEPSAEPVARWLFWHQLYCWLAKAEFTLGLALACTHAMGLASHDPTIEYLVDLIADVQTVRSCQTCHRARSGIHARGLLRAEPHAPFSRQHGDAEGAPAHERDPAASCRAPRWWLRRPIRDLADPELAAGLEESFAGGGYTAAQRAALLQMAWDHVGSALDHRESRLRTARQRRGGSPGADACAAASTATTSWPTA